METLTQLAAPPPRTLGPYELLREAGSGGMSTVYEALDTRIGRRVALKVVTIPGYLSQEMKQAQAARIKREARAIARLSHPNIVSVYDVGEQDGHHYLVMELLDGETLRARLNEGPLPLAETTRILEGVAGGLDAVHAQNVVHRDVKPSNVMLVPDGRIKLMDFGVARQVDDTLVTQVGTMVGSPAYMAPEQIEGQAPTPASDLWSLGVLLYEMLAGHPPFSSKSIPQVMYQVAHDAPPPVPNVSTAVQQVLNRALQKDPAKRFGSAGELAYAFRRALNPEAGAPVMAPPMASARSAARPFQPMPRLAPLPNRQARRLAGALAVLLLALLTAFATLAQRHRPSTQIARVVPMSQPAPVRVASQVPPIAPAVKPRVRVASSIESRQAKPAPVPPKPAVHAVAHHKPLQHRRPVVVETPRPRPHFRRPLRVAYAIPPVREARHPFRRLRHVPTTPAPARLASSPSPSSGDSVLGVWHGTHTRNPATLVINSRHGDNFAGTMTVRTHEATVRIAVDGQVSKKTGEVSMRERRVLWASKPRAWDLGREQGRLSGSGHIAGSGSDVKGRVGDWSFSR